MVQIINEGQNAWGRFGAGLGKGLAESLPKEMERGRLSHGLQKFEKESAGLSPMQQLTRLSAIPGITPQMIQSFGELAKHQSQGEGLKKHLHEGDNEPSPFRNKRSISSNESAGKSITTKEPIKATIENYIPKSNEEIKQRAAQLYQEERQLYPTPQDAINEARQEDQQNQAINQAQQVQRKTQQDVQSKVESELSNQAKTLGVELPGNILSEIQNKALDAVNKGKMTEKDAAIHFGKELDSISRDYKAVDTLGSLKILSGRTASGNKDAMKSLQKKFAERDDLENLADLYVTKNKLSPSKAAYLANPISAIKDLNNSISKLPTLEKKMSFRKGYAEMEVPQEYIRDKTLEVAEKIAPLMGNKASPLAIGEELKARNYDPKVWMDYVDKNRKKLKLTESQARELDKPRDFNNTINDLWLFYFSGLDPIVEEK